MAEEATQQLRNEAAQAAQRAISAEVKVEVLQKAVQQAEERVATLEMQVLPSFTGRCDKKLVERNESRSRLTEYVYHRRCSQGLAW